MTSLSSCPALIIKNLLIVRVGDVHHLAKNPDSADVNTNFLVSD